MPATQMSAPASGRASTAAFLFRDNVDSNGRGWLKGDWRAEFGRCHEGRSRDDVCTWWCDSWSGGRILWLGGWEQGWSPSTANSSEVAHLLTLVTHSIEGGAALVTPFVESRTATRTGPTLMGSWRGGLFPEGLDVHGRAWDVSHLRSFFTASWVWQVLMALSRVRSFS